MKYIIRWDAGYGQEYRVVESEDEEAAVMMAYEAWKEGAEQYADYDAEEYSDELAEEYDLK